MLNGIAYDAAHDRLFVTGKLWPKLFEIKVVPESAKPFPPKLPVANRNRRQRTVRSHSFGPLRRVYFPPRQAMDPSSIVLPGSLQNAAVLTIVLAFAGYLVTFHFTRMMARRSDRLRLVDQRLNDFYGPLYVAPLRVTSPTSRCSQSRARPSAIPSATKT